MKKKCAFITGGTSNQLFAMAVLAINIAKICPDIADELIVYTEKEINKAEQEKFNRIFPTRFIVYQYPFVDMEYLNECALRNFSKMVFCKYECFRLLDEYETIIWTDYDVVIKQSFPEILTQSTVNGSKIHARFLGNGDAIIAGKFSPSLYWHNCKQVLSEINILSPAVSTGIFVLFDTFPDYRAFYDECILTTEKYAGSLELPEEGVISVLLDKKKINWDLLYGNIYACHPINDTPSEDTKILHAASHPKFWESGLEDTDWNQNYAEWKNKYKGKARVKTNHKIKKIIKFLLPYWTVKLLKW